MAKLSMFSFQHQSTASGSEEEWQQEPKMKEVEQILVKKKQTKTNRTRYSKQNQGV